MKRLIAGEYAVFGGADFASLQAEIIEQLIVERAEMLLLMMRSRSHALSLSRTAAATRPAQSMPEEGDAKLDQMS
jgi:hypothetical protein